MRHFGSYSIPHPLPKLAGTRRLGVLLASATLGILPATSLGTSQGAGFAYKVGDGTAAGGRLVVDRPGQSGPFSIPIQGAPIRWVNGWKAFAVQERDRIFRVDLEGKRTLVYDLGPLVREVVDSVRRRPQQKGAVSDAYDIDVTPQGDRLVLLTRADWGVREIDLKAKRTRLITTGDRIAKAVGQKLRLAYESQTGVRWSPDGRQIALAIPGVKAWGEDGDESDAALFVASAQGTRVKRLGSGVPIDWMAAGELLTLFTPEGGDRRELRVYSDAGALKSKLGVATPVEVSWNGQSVLFLRKRPGGSQFVVAKATPGLKVLGTEEVSDRPSTLTGIPKDGMLSVSDSARRTSEDFAP